MNYSILNRKFKYTYSNVCTWILAVNVVVFFLCRYTNFSIKGVPFWCWISLIPTCINSYGWVWQFVTYMFVHSDFMHIFFNMYALFMFGTMLERCLGSREFLLFYFVTGTLGGVLCYLISLITGSMNIAIMGASGAIYAMLFLTSVMFPNGKVLLFFIIPLKMPVAVLVFIIFEAGSQILGTSTGVAHLAHLSSMLIAWLYCIIRFRISPVKVWKDALKR